MATHVIEVSGLHTRFGGRVIHEDLDLTVRRGEILALVGASGTGKSTLLREMIGLARPAKGTVRVLGRMVSGVPEGGLSWLRRSAGVLFQGGALFSSLTVLENTALPLAEHTDLDPVFIRELALVKILLAGLPRESAGLFPSELSGGMRKRAGLARAIALDPELLFLDEPTSGLDPVSSDAFDDLILRLRTSLGLTVVMVTHDLDSLLKTADRVAILGDRRILAVGPLPEVARIDHPFIREFFHGPRGRTINQAAWKHGSATPL